MASSGGFWDLVNAPAQTAQQQAKPTLVSGPAAEPTPGTGYYNPNDNWDVKAPVQDLFKTSMKQYVSGNYQTAYDIMDYLAKNRPDELKSFDAGTGDPLNTPAARLYKRLQVQLNVK